MAISAEKVGLEADVQAPTKESSIDQGAVEHSKQEDRGIDDALVFATEHHVDYVSPEEDRRLLWKIDLVILPILLTTYSLKFLDQQAMSYSSNFSLLSDMHLSVNQYAWASGSIINLAIVVFQPFANRILQIVPLGRFVSVSVIVWGTLLMCTAGARSFAGIAVLRTFLGFAESGITPAMVLIVAMWYKRDGEQPGRQGTWFLGNALAQIVGGLIGYGVGHIQSRLSVGPWIWFFIIVGAVTFLWGIALLFILPDNPMTAKFLTPQERAVAVARVKDNHTGIINHQWKWSQFRECMLDLNIWLYCSILFLSAIPSGGVASFGNIVIKQFGFSALNTTLLSIPLGGVQAISLLASGWVNSKFKNIRNLVAAISQVPPLIGAVLLTTLPQSNKVGRLLSYYIIQTHTVNDVMMYAVFSGNTAGFTKKVTGSALMFIWGSVGLIVGPQLFIASEAPSYPTAFNAAITCFVLQIVLPFALQLYLYWQNRKKRQLQATLPPATEEELAQEGLMDLTDKEQPHFRYVY
ncbi:Major facilitator superfamily domain, general substrate transporter [Niveomyces insectorum RCEF 264]|uniref:Major facilitator superfamily domain, general substrate transporter n=1 Tax=Niveomyces insectorum RCEF 264 TaxID=1081102 RepID=A0A167SIM0_9HYPO|nr:Major facilitator superfamily domain, general substrate transporter [Niveomyces insectorum RCEF 264]